MITLITGIAGRIGSILAPDLDRDHKVYGLDLLPSERANTTQVDLCDAAALAPIFEGIEVVIHLAADPRHEVAIGWDALMNPNVIATARMYDAAHAAGVRRVIFASSMHAMGGYEFDEPYLSIVSGRFDDLDPAAIDLVKGDDPPRPDSRYGATKIFGESLGRYYAEPDNIDRVDQRQMEVICVRLGTLPRSDRPGSGYRSRVSWFSSRDAAGFFRACVERPNLGYEIFYGASRNTWKIYDTPHAWDVLDFMPYGLFIDADDYVWVTDRQEHVVTKHTQHGEKLLELGRRGWAMMTVTPYGTSLDGPFNMPAGVAVAQDGTIFVADGYGNRQVRRFSPEGELELSWGTSGTGPGQFALVHNLGIDTQGRILVCDRKNSRIQLFDREGQFIEIWDDVNAPGDVYVSPDKLVYVAEQGISAGPAVGQVGVSILSESGELVGRFRGEESGMVMPHSIWTDSRSNVFVGELGDDGNHVRKFVKI